MVGAIWLSDRVVNAIFPHITHKLCVLATLFAGSIRCQKLWASKVMDKLPQRIACQGLAFHRVGNSKEVLACEYLRELVAI